MEAESARIAAGSKWQAMDWSLVLLSQGIEAVIEHSEEEGSWSLAIPDAARAAALEAIRLYEEENQRRPWRQETFNGGPVFDWAALAWGCLACVFYWLGAGAAFMREAGLMDSDAVGRGQWWRLFTAMWLHADLAHLAANVTIGIVLLGLAMGRYGAGLGLLASYLAGAAGNAFAGGLARQPHHSLGASGMVMGCLGLLAVHSLWLWRRGPRETRDVLRGLGAGVMLFILMGVTPGTDIAAHFGGFLGGVILGAGLSRLRHPGRRPVFGLACGLVFALLVILPWWLALRASR